MAKKEHEEELTGGLTSGLNFGASKDAKKSGGMETPAVKPVVQTQTEELNLSVYPRKKRTERRSEKLNILIKPSIRRKMDEAVDNGEAKNLNDLINTLLEQHFAMDEAIKSGKIKSREDLVEYVLRLYSDGQ